MINEKTSKILIHVCCADCLEKMLSCKEFVKVNETSNSVSDNDSQKNKNPESSLITKELEFTVLFYNPNIHPRTEMMARYEAVKSVVSKHPEVKKMITADWSPKEFFSVVKSPDNRCPACWSLRIGKLFSVAKENGFDRVSSTLLTSHYQDGDVIKKIALSYGKKLGIEFYEPKDICIECCVGGYYKQNYCGCVYSLLDRYTEKYLTSESSNAD